MARARAVCVALVASTLAASTVLQGVPIGAANTTSLFVYLLSPPFALPGGPLTSATLWFAALGSPRKNPAGTTQAKLLGAAMVRVNGVLVTGGPGHNIPTNSTVVRGADVLPFLRFGGEPNVIGIASFYDRSQASGVPPRVQAWLNVTTAAGDEYTAAATGPAWLSWGADAYHQPTGDAGVSWYPMPNEFLDRRAYPAGWSEPGFAGGPSWESAVQAPAWDAPPYLEPRGAPVLLTRDACSVVHVSPTRQILDYGTEFMGGVNLTFVGAARGTTVTVVLAEELNPDGQSVRSPLRTGNKWNSTWTLAGGFADGGIVHHEFVQFRYVQVDGNVPPLAAGPGGGASAWNIIHPAGGLGVNVFDAPCAAATPAAAAWGAGAPAPSPLGSFSSSRPDLDRVWSFCASTIIATSLDVNVDGQTRERDVDIVDALNTARGQYSVFSPGDVVVPERTLREAFGNDTGQFSQWMDVRCKDAVRARSHPPPLYPRPRPVPAVQDELGARRARPRAVDGRRGERQRLLGRVRQLSSCD